MLSTIRTECRFSSHCHFINCNIVSPQCRYCGCTGSPCKSNRFIFISCHQCNSTQHLPHTASVIIRCNLYKLIHCVSAFLQPFQIFQGCTCKTRTCESWRNIRRNLPILPFPTLDLHTSGKVLLMFLQDRCVPCYLLTSHHNIDCVLQSYLSMCIPDLESVLLPE